MTLRQAAMAKPFLCKFPPGKKAHRNPEGAPLKTYTKQVDLSSSRGGL